MVNSTSLRSQLALCPHKVSSAHIMPAWPCLNIAFHTELVYLAILSCRSGVLMCEHRVTPRRPAEAGPGSEAEAVPGPGAAPSELGEPSQRAGPGNPQQCLQTEPLACTNGAGQLRGIHTHTA